MYKGLYIHTYIYTYALWRIYRMYIRYKILYTIIIIANLRFFRHLNYSLEKLTILSRRMFAVFEKLNSQILLFKIFTKRKMAAIPLWVTSNKNYVKYFTPFTLSKL